MNLPCSATRAVFLNVKGSGRIFMTFFPSVFHRAVASHASEKMGDRRFQPSPDYGGDPPSLRYGATRKAATCCWSVAGRVAGWVAVTRSARLVQSPNVNVNVTGLLLVCCRFCCQLTR